MEAVPRMPLEGPRAKPPAGPGTDPDGPAKGGQVLPGLAAAAEGRVRPSRAPGPGQTPPRTGSAPVPARRLQLRPSGGRGGVLPLAVRPSAVPVRDVLRGPGQPLAVSVRAEMETRLDADLSDVRVHTDAAARASATQLGARAYTSGSHIVIGDGGTDQHTLAHELIHVTQQRRGTVAGKDNGSGLSVSDPADRDERAAEAEAARVLRAPLSRLDPVGGRGRLKRPRPDRVPRGTAPRIPLPVQRVKLLVPIGDEFRAVDINDYHFVTRLHLANPQVSSTAINNKHGVVLENFTDFNELAIEAGKHEKEDFTFGGIKWGWRRRMEGGWNEIFPKSDGGNCVEVKGNYLAELIQLARQRSEEVGTGLQGNKSSIKKSKDLGMDANASRVYDALVGTAVGETGSALFPFTLHEKSLPGYIKYQPGNKVGQAFIFPRSLGIGGWHVHLFGERGEDKEGQYIKVNRVAFTVTGGENHYHIGNPKRKDGWQADEGSRERKEYPLLEALFETARRSADKEAEEKGADEEKGSERKGKLKKKEQEERKLWERQPEPERKQEEELRPEWVAHNLGLDEKAFQAWLDAEADADNKIDLNDLQYFDHDTFWEIYGKRYIKFTDKQNEQQSKKQSKKSKGKSS
jgi:Domain of unknown function (DUF4157)